ncbi:MAG: DNRLRE domain-containing protein [Clostridia bacterium]|nr:DNRLRE domain-containing protein [Clostridia bacterium]
MCKIQRKILALLLSVALLLTCFPIITSASENTQADAIEKTVVETVDNDTDSTVENQSETESDIIGEIIDKREANVKHFKMSDGSYTAAVYPYDVHFENSNGEFLDIDNSLSSDIDGTDKIYSNKNNETFVKFMKKSNPNKLYTINKGEHKIKVSIDGVSKVKAILEETNEESSIDSKYKLENIGSKISYNDILDNTDIEYTLISTELKENIILKEKVDFNSLVYTYHLSGSMNAVQKDSKNIELYDKDGNFVFNISAPVMWDAEDKTFEDLSLEILETKNSKIKVKISWNIPEDFKYPVTIDPVMEFRIDRNSIQDTHIISAYPTTNYDVNNHIRVRNNGYAMVKFPTPSLTSGDKIINAELMLYPYGAFDTSSSVYSNENSYNPPLNITAHKILRTWEETTATYSNVNADNGFYESIAQSYRVVNGNNGFYKWDITRLVNEWTEGFATNYGVLLKYEAPPSDGSMFDSFFCSTNGKFIDSNAWPRMVYQYINTTGVEDYFSYHTQNLGAAGTGYTNDLTGNLTVINPVLQTGGSLAPITVSLIYNSNNVNNAQTPYGTGWKLNWAQKIDWSVKSNFNNTQYVKYTDGDGTNHFFTVDNSTGIWTDEINPDRKVYFIESSGDYKMTDSSGTCMYFTRKGSSNEWYLYKTVDVYGNYIQLTLNSSNLNRVEKIYSSSGSEVNLVYSQYGFLTSIKYYDEGTEKNISIGYNGHVQTANNGISDIYYADGTSVQYHYYNNSKYLSKAVDISGQNITYNYTWKTPMRVNYVAEYSNNSELGNVMQMKYEATSTTFTDVTNNRKYLYTFAQNGTLKGTVDITANDGNGYGQYYEYNNGNTTALSGQGNLTFISKTQKSAVNLINNHSFEKDSNLPSFQVWNETVGTSTGSISTDKSYIGSRSYKLYQHEQSNSTRVLGFYSKNLKGGTTYTLSAYVNTAGMVSTGRGAHVFATCNDFRAESEYITKTSNEWQRISVTFTPINDGYVSICMGLCGATGTVYFDNIQLEIGDLSDYNLLENAGFENDNSEIPYAWSASTNKGSISTSQKIAGNRALFIQGKSTVDKHYMQTISVPNGKKGDTYVASAFAKANAVPLSGWKFIILIRFYKDSTTVNEQSILFNSYTTEWQKVAGVAKASGDYNKVTFWLLYYKNCNTVYFDNAQLIKDTFGTSYTYDSKGNLLSTVDLEGKAEYTFNYNGNNQLIKESTVSGGKILYSYNSSKKQQLDLVTAGGISTYYDYDSHGNAVTASAYGSGIIDGQYYYLRNIYYDKNISVNNSATTNGTAIKYSECAQNSAQKWKITKNSDGTYNFSPECAQNLFLSVEPSNLSNNARIALYSQGAVAHQKFTLEKVNANIYIIYVGIDKKYSVEGDVNGCYAYSSYATSFQQFAFIPARGNHSEEYPAIISSATYTENGEYTSSVTDSRGNTTSYEYNEDRGYLKSEINANGVATNYSYYGNELLQNVSLVNGEQTSTVSYGYDSYKRLSDITSPSGTIYGFTYDSFGRSDTIKVGTRTLSDYLYDSKGRVDSFTYGNGTAVKYGYDKLNRQTSTTINNVLRYNKLYDGHSRLLQIEDILLGKKIKYEYDILDRLVGERLINTATNKAYADLFVRYDNSKNRVAGYDVNIEGINKATDFVYGENKSAPDIITSVKHNGTKKIGYSYDSLNRIIARTLSTGTAFTTEYTYIAGRTKGSET